MNGSSRVCVHVIMWAYTVNTKEHEFKVLSVTCLEVNMTEHNHIK